MSVLVYAESEQGKFKKVALEVASYARAVANQLGTTVTAVTFNANDTSELGNYGVDKVLQITNAQLESFNAKDGDAFFISNESNVTYLNMQRINLEFKYVILIVGRKQGIEIPVCAKRRFFFAQLKRRGGAFLVSSLFFLL